MWFSKQSCSPVTPAETDSDVFFPPGSALSGGACVTSSLWVLTSLFETLSIAQGWDDSVAAVAAEAPVRSSERLFPKRSRERRLFIYLRTSTLTSWQHLPVLHKNILVQAILESEAECGLVWKDAAYVEGCLIYLTTQRQWQNLIPNALNLAGRFTGRNSPLSCVPVQAVVLMEGTDLARRSPWFSDLPCSHLERCWKTLMTASFSRSWAWRARILNAEHTHDEFEKCSGCKIELWRSGAVEKGTCSSSPGVCDWAGCHWNCCSVNDGVSVWWWLYLCDKYKQG